jgi:hypothetical protein
MNIHEKGIMRQVGYLQRLYRDARSTERIKVGFYVKVSWEAVEK